jgi:antitoxin component of MazEF toxin-antitoxin module
VLIPDTIAERARMTEGTEVEIKLIAGGIMLRRKGVRPRRSMAEIVSQIKPANYRRQNAELSM